MTELNALAADETFELAAFRDRFRQTDARPAKNDRTATNVRRRKFKRRLATVRRTDF
jgi:hypothetical protein